MDTVEPRHIIIGTSGHIDHGKSAVIKALTGTDPDRLQEEKQRGLTIDLGYAFYSDHVAFIDVPGHEKFIKNMVAGVATIDFVMLVIAADDGVMPQTREHLDILQVLGVERGIIVINKIDLVESEWLELVDEDIRSLTENTFLHDAPIVHVSSVTHEGIDTLRQGIDKMVQEPTSRRDQGYFWLPIDRSFSIQGFGTVVTGSVVSGELRVGEEVELLPEKRTLKVRGLQRHGKKSETVRIGDRAAVNLQGIHRNEIQRGDILATKGYGLVTKRLDVQLQLLPSSPWKIKHQNRLRLHIGTNEIFTRVRLLNCRELLPGESAFVQLILESPVTVNRRDRFVVRMYSPMLTIGGGVVLDNYPLHRHKRFDKFVLQHFERILEENPETIILEYLQNSRKPRTLEEIYKAASMPQEQIEQILEKLSRKGDVYSFQQGLQTYFLPQEQWQNLKKTVMNVVESFHRKNPHLPGINRTDLGAKLWKTQNPLLLEALLNDLIREGKIEVYHEVVHETTFHPGLTPEQKQFYEELIEFLKTKQYTPPSLKELYEKYAKMKTLLDVIIPYGKSSGELVVLPNDLVYYQPILDEMKEKTRQFISEHESMRVADFRDMIQASRKYAVAILEYFDEIGFTQREGDERTLIE